MRAIYNDYDPVNFLAVGSPSALRKSVRSACNTDDPPTPLPEAPPAYGAALLPPMIPPIAPPPMPVEPYQPVGLFSTGMAPAAAGMARPGTGP